MNLTPRLYRVTKRKKEIRDTYTLELAPEIQQSPDGDFSPGQFNMVSAFGIGEVPLSMSGKKTATGSFVHTVRIVGAVSRALCALEVGSLVGVRGPFGNQWPVEQAKGNDVVVVAGGLGLPPLRPAIYSLLSERQKYGRVSLYYGSRSPEDLLYRKELEEWRSRFDMDVQISVDHAAGAWRGNVGTVTSMLTRAAFDAPNTIALICGPEVMMKFAALEFMKHGLEADQIYLSMERNMKCAEGICGRCQFGPFFVCKDGPVFRYSIVKPWLQKGEI